MTSDTTELTERTRATRDKLLAVARTVFEDNGYDGSSVSQIVEGAEVSRGTFYLYFDSKEDVLRSVAERLHEQIVAAQHWPRDLEPTEIVRRATRKFLQVYSEHARMMAVIEQVAAHDPSFRELRLSMRRGLGRGGEGLLRNLQARGLASPTLDPRYAGIALTGMTDRFAYIWFVLEEDFDMDTAVETLVELWCRAMGFPFDAAPS